MLVRYHLHIQVKARGGGMSRSKNQILLEFKHVEALTFLISEWAGFLQSALRFKSYDCFCQKGHEGLTPIFLDFPYVLHNARFG